MGDHPFWFWTDVALGLASFVLLPFRRRWPVRVAALIAVFGVASYSSAGPFCVALVSLATHRRWSQILPVAVLAAAAGTAYLSLVPSKTGWSDQVLLVLVTAVLIATGLYVGARRELIAALQDRAERAEREQAVHVARARAGERARIAREMHDVLAHRMSLVAMHSGALTYRTDLDPEETGGPRR